MGEPRPRHTTTLLRRAGATGLLLLAVGCTTDSSRDGAKRDDPILGIGARPAYQAPGGYAGTQLLLALSRRYPNYWIGAYVRHDWLQAAVFSDSPLVQQRSYWAGGLAIVWMIRASARMVDSDE